MQPEFVSSASHFFLFSLFINIKGINEFSLLNVDRNAIFSIWEKNSF